VAGQCNHSSDYIAFGYTVWEQQLGKSCVVQQEQHMSFVGMAATQREWAQ
jgi:hypothetical protein